jgi:hypothetical protein
MASAQKTGDQDKDKPAIASGGGDDANVNVAPAATTKPTTSTVEDDEESDWEELDGTVNISFFGRRNLSWMSLSVVHLCLREMVANYNFFLFSLQRFWTISTNPNYLQM